MEVKELWRLAVALRQHFGEEAEYYARLKADEASQMRNNRSCAVWKRIALAVRDLEQRAATIQDLN